MSIQYHVLLPPTSLSSLPLPSPSTDHSPLHFHTLSAPSRHPTLSQSSLAPRHAALPVRISPHVPEHDTNATPGEEDKGDGLGKDESGISQLDRGKGGEALQCASSKRQRKASPDQSRRRSRRLARTSGDSSCPEAHGIKADLSELEYRYSVPSPSSTRASPCSHSIQLPQTLLYSRRPQQETTRSPTFLDGISL